jgi:UDP-N-acetylmuramoyl-L-alanyl-D-glutamate--2,6-diaminopimelate ligase
MSMPAEHLTAAMTLDDLLHGYADAPAIPVSGIASDSRLLQPGDLFLACSGKSGHGLDYIDDALQVGVAAVAFDASTASPPAGGGKVPVIAVPDLAQHLGALADRFFGSPSQAVRVVGVTGTNGKTTVAWMIAQCLDCLEHTCGYVGTLGHGIRELAGGEGLTTPGSVELHSRLSEFRDAGADYAAVEVSSHALAQKRIDGFTFDTVVFTNLSRDHLDYHRDMESYGTTKARLFLDYAARHRIINLDSEFGARLAARFGRDVVIVSADADRVADDRPYVFVRSIDATATGSRVKVSTSWGDGEFMLPVPGDFNVENAAAALAFLLCHEVTLVQACKALAEVEAPPGRMQRVPAADGLPSVYIDYAHSPEALEVVLRALRTHCAGQLWCVFGCGGDRDAGKRPLMGEVAERCADRVILTSDNPRGEAPDRIIAMIAAGHSNPDAVTIIEDRANAIARAIKEAGPRDLVLIAGKGHERYQLINGERRDFSDFEVAAENLVSRAEVTE